MVKKQRNILHNLLFRVMINVFAETPMGNMAGVLKASVDGHVLVTAQKYVEEVGETAFI